VEYDKTKQPISKATAVAPPYIKAIVRDFEAKAPKIPKHISAHDTALKITITKLHAINATPTTERHMPPPVTPAQYPDKTIMPHGKRHKQIRAIVNISPTKPRALREDARANIPI
jgi:hypothetical protein